jgi:hypothetical protein
MRQIVITPLLLMAMAASTVLADDYLRIKVDSINKGSANDLIYLVDYIFRFGPPPCG